MNKTIRISSLGLFIICITDYLKVLFGNNMTMNAVICFLVTSLLVLKILSVSTNKSGFFKIILCGIISIFSLLLVNETSVFFVFAGSIFLYNEDKRKCIKQIFLTYLIGFFTVLLLGVTGIINSNNMVRAGTTKMRYSLGFGHVNEVFLFLLPIMFAGYLLYFNKSRAKYNILAIGFSLILFLATNCRTGLFTFLIFMFMINLKPSKLKITKYVPYLFIIFTAISYFLGSAYGADFTNIYNKVLSYRPWYWYKYIHHYSLISFGGSAQDCVFPLDNLYLNILYAKGIIIYLFYFLIFYLYYRKNKSKPINKINIILFSFLVYGVFEANIISGSLDFITFFIVNSLFDKSNNGSDDILKLGGKNEG